MNDINYQKELDKVRKAFEGRERPKRAGLYVEDGKFIVKFEWHNNPSKHPAPRTSFCEPA